MYKNPYKLFNNIQILDAIEKKTTSASSDNYLLRRVAIDKEENVASTKCNAKVIFGDFKLARLDDVGKNHVKIFHSKYLQH